MLALLFARFLCADLDQSGRVPPLPIKSSLAYVESSAGLSPPSMDGGFTEIEMGDVNADGYVDLLTIGDHGSPFVNTGQHGVTVYFGDGTGAWIVAQNGDFGYGGVALGDVNNDGRMDVGYGMHHNWSANDFGDQLLEVALGDGSGLQWQPWDDGLATNGETWGMAGTDFADVDNDGDLDVGSISFGCCSGVHVYLNQGDGSWVQSFGFLGGNSNEDIVFGEVNGDGNADFAVGHDAGTVYLGDGKGGFVLGDGNLPPPGFLGVRGSDLGDVNGDGRDDLAFVNGSGGVEVWLAVANGVWAQAGGGLPGAGPWQRAQLGDMNSDGRLDLAAFGNKTVTVAIGDGTGGFRYAGGFQTANPGDATALRVQHDLDRNGFLDIVLVSEEGGIFNSRNQLRCYLEDSQPARLSISFLAPRANATLIGGSIRFIDWLSAVPGSAPATIDLELSTNGPGGPWIPLAIASPDSGRYQWLVPTVPSTDARLRLTIHTAAGSATSVGGRFTIL